MYFVAVLLFLAKATSVTTSRQGHCPKNHGTISSSTAITLKAAYPVYCVLKIQAGISTRGRIRILFLQESTNANRSEVNIVDNNETTIYDVQGITSNVYNSLSNIVTLRIFSDESTTTFYLRFRVIVKIKKDPRTTSAPPSPSTSRSRTSLESTPRIPLQTISSETSTTRSLLLSTTQAATISQRPSSISPTTSISTTPTRSRKPEETPSQLKTTLSTKLLSKTLPTATHLFTPQPLNATAMTFRNYEQNESASASSDTCIPAIFISRGISLYFSKTPQYHLALSTNVCENGRPKGTAVCLKVPSLLSTMSPMFQAVHGVACNVTFSSLKNNINRLVLSDLVVLTSLPTLLTVENITDVIYILQTASKRVEVNREVLLDVTNTISNLATWFLTQKERTSQPSSSSAALLSSLRTFTSQSFGNFEIITPNIEILAREPSFGKNRISGTDMLFEPILNKNASGGSVTIQNSSSNQAALKNSSIFALFALGSTFTNQSDCTSQIIGVGATNSNKANVSYKMSFGRYQALQCLDIVKSRKKNQLPSRCSFGQLKKLNNAEWKKESACKLVNGEYNCESPGTFALFFTSVRIPHVLELSIITYIGCGISILFLLITVVVHLTIREVRKKATTLYQLNICVCLLALYFFFCIGITMKSHGPTCDFMAFAIQFFVLATFAWMSVNSYKMLRIFAQFNYDIKSYTTLVSVVTYGLPLLISITSYLISLNYFDRLYEDPNAIILSDECKTYGTEKVFRACWLHGDSQIYGFFVPVGLCLFFNLVIFFILIKIVIFRKNTIRSSRKERKAKDKIINAVAMATMMGLTWIIGFFLLFTEDKTYHSIVQWLFSIVNTLLGVMIFYLSCLRRRDIQKMWVPESVRRLGISRRTTYYVRSGSSMQFNGSSYKRNFRQSKNSNFNESTYRSKRALPEPMSTAL